MNSELVQSAILRVASLLAPGNQRAAWLEEWRSELWYVPRREAMRFCLGSFQDALWLRRNSPRPVKRARIHLESPFTCLGVLAALAAVSLVVSAREQPSLRWPEILALDFLMMAAAFAIRDYPANLRAMRWPTTPRSWIFLALKIVLILMVTQCGLAVAFLVLPVPLGPLWFIVGCILLFRWIFTDQRGRCPVCLRLLSNPVRIGTLSRTFLAWYGTESICSRGHGVLHAPEVAASYTGKQEWLNLDGSWSELFSDTAGARR